MSVAKLDVIEQYLDNNGDPLAGGQIYTYAGGTTDPLAVYTDATGLVAHSNPITLDSAGRPPGDGVWFTAGTAYKVVLKTAAGVTLETIDGLIAPDTSAAASGQRFIIDFLYHGAAPPLANEWLGGHSFDVAVTLPANAAGAFGNINTNPTSSFVLSLRKNAKSSSGGTQIGTVTVATGGTFTFATTTGAAQSFAAGDHLSVWGPGTADATANDFNFTLIGTVTA